MPEGAPGECRRGEPPPVDKKRAKISDGTIKCNVRTNWSTHSGSKTQGVSVLPAEGSLEIAKSLENDSSSSKRLNDGTSKIGCLKCREKMISDGERG